MKTKSLKAKGRRLQNWVKSKLNEILNIPYEEIDTAIMGEGGIDVTISPAWRDAFPYAIECKNVERLNIWKAWEQANSNANGLAPMLIFAKSRHKPLAVVEAETLIRLHK